MFWRELEEHETGYVARMSRERVALTMAVVEQTRQRIRYCLLGFSIDRANPQDQARLRATRSLPKCTTIGKPPVKQPAAGRRNRAS